jgi:hypothetical protein
VIVKAFKVLAPLVSTETTLSLITSMSTYLDDHPNIIESYDSGTGTDVIIVYPPVKSGSSWFTAFQTFPKNAGEVGADLYLRF